MASDSPKEEEVHAKVEACLGQPANSSPEELTILGKLQHNLPRSYYVTTRLMLPLLTLILMSFLFGWIVARLEMEGEIQKNDDILKTVYEGYSNHTAERQRIWSAMANASVQCLVGSVDKEILQSIPSEALDGIQTCSRGQGEKLFVTTTLLDFLYMESPELTFNWMECHKPVSDEDGDSDLEETSLLLGKNPRQNLHRQGVQYIFRFGYDFVRSFCKAYPEYCEQLVSGNLPKSLNATVNEFINEATGSEGCQAHVAGGALFWFTVMTTIGYGNAAPETGGGRAMVFTLGFFSIIAFLALNNSASNVWRDLFEDCFLRCGLPQFVNGPLSVLFWLFMTIFWMLLVAFSAQAAWRDRVGEELPLDVAYWLSYVTTTTIGFGDYHISHEEFTAGDMFFAPLILLIGFNFLGIFAEKLIDLYFFYLPERNNFKKILKERRTKSTVERLEG